MRDNKWIPLLESTNPCCQRRNYESSPGLANHPTQHHLRDHAARHSGGGAREDGAPEDKLARLRTEEDRQQPWWELCVNGIPRPSWLKDNGRKKTFTVMLSVY